MNKAPAAIRIGIAGWSIRREHAARYGEGASHLARYATRFDAVEINSSFYRPHRAKTYARWAASVPDAFRFAVKMDRIITHELRLRDADDALDAFLAPVRELGEKLGPILVQLPPSLAFEADVARRFFASLRARWPGALACELRHPSWFTGEANDLLRTFKVARVAADPAPVSGAGEPGGWPGLIYVRLHGAPRIYYSSYAAEALARWASLLHERSRAGAECWCILDNTALGAATDNAFELKVMLAGAT